MEEESINNILNEENLNTSGGGPEAIVPDDVAEHFNWGAFLLNWVWGIGNKSYITLLILLAYSIPLVNLIAPLAFCIWFGFEGNKWAWQNKRFESIEHFHSYQKKWVVAGLILPVIGLILSIFVFTHIMPVLMTDTKSMRNDSFLTVEQSKIKQSVSIKEALGKTCDLSSAGLAKCFEEDFYNIESSEGNKFNLSSGIVVEFTGDGYCGDDNGCYVTIKTSSKSDAKSVTVPLYADDNGYLFTEDEEGED